MVFFSCDGCGESLKKNQVEKHDYRCRSNSYSCIDCQQVFTRQSHAEHIKCITENQKYGGKNYVEKEAKGEIKQNAWVDQVERAIAAVTDRDVKQLLEQIKGFSNIPRKETKFINFLTNSCRIRNRTLCERAWKAIATEAEKIKKQDEEAKAKAAEVNNKAASADESLPESKDTNSSTTENSELETSETVSNVEFKWKKSIKRKLKDQGGEMKLKKLRTAVLEEFKTAGGSADEGLAIFEQKLQSAGVVVDGKKAVLA